MDILVDENIPLTSVFELREMGHNVLDIRKTAEEGLPDEGLWNKALKEKRLLITTDRGFAHYRDRAHYGILIILLRKPNRQKINNRVIEAMKQFSSNQWPGLLVVMRDTIISTWRASPDK
jgi:predicted nuclease of predicted toxin-antitoxin system